MFSYIFLLLLSQSLVVFGNLDCSAESLASFLPANTTITVADSITKYGTSPHGEFNLSISRNVTSDALPICVLELNVKSSDNTSFNAGVILPNNWNGRLLGTGNPGFGGGIRWSFLTNALKYGPAVTVSTDTGHVGPPNNISFAINNPDGILDWSYRSLHESTVLAKTLAKAFYGSDVKHAYYTACSNGGRQGLKEVQMFPGDYDGVLAGAPPWQITHLHTWAVQLGMWNLPNNSASHIDSWKFPLIQKAIMDQCDAQDGLVDGIMQQPYSCNFSSAAILCNKTSKANTCLTQPEIQTLNLFYNDWKASDGSLIFPRFPLSASAGRYGSVTDAPDHFGLEFFYGFVENTTDWDWTTFKGEEAIKKVDAMNPGNAAAVDMDLSEFKAGGGKLIMYHGLADTTIPTGHSIEYFQGVNGTMGSVDDFFQLYIIPGMGHCGESEVAPYFIAAAGQVVKTSYGNSYSVPGYEDPEHDVLLAMMRWVENGTAPTHLIASKWNNNTLESGIAMQRPICPYPQKAVYGSGEWKLPASWSCQEGEVMAFPAVNGSLGTVKVIENATADATANGTTSGKNAGTSVKSLFGNAIMLGGWGVMVLLVMGSLF